MCICEKRKCGRAHKEILKYVNIVHAISVEEEERKLHLENTVVALWGSVLIENVIIKESCSPSDPSPVAMVSEAAATHLQGC